MPYIIIRDFKDSDIFDIEDIHKDNCKFPLPDYTSPSNVALKTILLDGNIVGSSFVHLTAEIGLILNQDLLQVTRAKIIRDLFLVLLREMEQTDLTDCHVFVTDHHFATILQNNFNFEPDKGIGLCRGLKHEQIERESSKRFSEELDDVGSRQDPANS